MREIKNFILFNGALSEYDVKLLFEIMNDFSFDDNHYLNKDGQMEYWINKKNELINKFNERNKHRFKISYKTFNDEIVVENIGGKNERD